jgi:site-specific recombinase XerC
MGTKTGRRNSLEGEHHIQIDRAGRPVFRVRVPLDVQPHFGVKEVFRSLGTRQPGAAKRERDRLLEEYRNAFEAARSLPPVEDYRAVMARYGLRSDTVTREDIDRLKAALKMEADIAAEADAAYEAHLEEQHREAREWVDSLSDGEIDALRRRALYNHRAPMLEGQAARPIGAFTADGIVVPDEAALEIDVLEGKAAPKQPEKQSEKFTISDALEHYLAHNNEISPKTKDEWKRIIDLFIQCHGDVYIHSITKIIISEFILYRKGINTNRGTPPSLSTINKDIAALRSVLQCCMTHGYLENNPASGFTKKVKNNTTKRLPLLISEIERVEIDEKDRDFWIWKMLIYTGARLGEIAQLHKKDVENVGSVWSLTLHLEEGGHLKNEPSIRRVPIHKDILKPFMNWLNTRPSESFA